MVLPQLNKIIIYMEKQQPLCQREKTQDHQGVGAPNSKITRALMPILTEKNKKNALNAQSKSKAVTLIEIME